MSRLIKDVLVMTAPPTPHWCWRPAAALTVLPVVILPFLDLPPWLKMWGLALTLWSACKVGTFLKAAQTLGFPSLRRTLAYFLLWPGMDAQRFLDESLRPPAPPRGEWLAATGKMFAGLLLIAAATQVTAPLAQGWLGMIGLILTLHFGSFHLLALYWQKRGIAIRPIMQAPLRATSLAEFWGQRWNVAFHELAQDLVFQPWLRTHRNAATATLLTFFASGLVHELVITVPGGGGYGGPTAYFTLQAVGLLIERSRLGRKFGLRQGGRGWVWMLLITAPAAWLLFPPPFVLQVMRPFLQILASTCVDL